MKKILILYFSGAGATKKAAELMRAFLLRECAAELFSVENAAAVNIDDYDALIIGTPVYHASPSREVVRFFDGINPLKKPAPAFIFCTRGLYSCNTNRILAKRLKKKNIITVMDREYRSPASDGSLIMPSVKRFFEFEKRFNEKIFMDCANFVGLLHERNPQGYTPRFRFSAVINAPNKLAGKLITFKIHLSRERCVKCGKCVENCPYGAIGKDSADYPAFLKKKCENCYRCIHNCPRMALSLSGRRKTEKVLEYK